MASPFFLSDLAGPPVPSVLINERSGAIVATTVEAAFDSETRRRGLLGRDSLPPMTAMAIAPCAAVHTFFMRFTIDVVFVRRDGRVVKACRAVRPWRIAVAFGAYAVLELAAGGILRGGIERGDCLRLRRA